MNTKYKTPRVVNAISKIKKWRNNKESTTLVKIADECFVSYNHVKRLSMEIGREASNESQRTKNS